MIATRPRARKDRLLVRDLGDEVVVYELDSHLGHALNRTASLVWRACDGRTTVAGIAARLGRELGIRPDEHLVRLALRKLRDARLLEPAADAAASLSRRQVARRIGQAALLPLVVSVLAPTPSEAGTCTCGVGQYCDCSAAPENSSCWNGSNCSTYICCSGHCCQFCGGPCYN